MRYRRDREIDNSATTGRRKKKTVSRCTARAPAGVALVPPAYTCIRACVHACASFKMSRACSSCTIVHRVRRSVYRRRLVTKARAAEWSGVSTRVKSKRNYERDNNVVWRLDLLSRLRDILDGRFSFSTNKTRLQQMFFACDWKQPSVRMLFVKYLKLSTYAWAFVFP